MKKSRCVLWARKYGSFLSLLLPGILICQICISVDILKYLPKKFLYMVGGHVYASVL